MQPVRRAVLRSCVALLLSAVLVLGMGGCNGFFSCAKASCPISTTGGSGTGSGSSGSTADYVYVANSSAGPTWLSEYSIGSNTLTLLNTLNLGYIPVALAVSPNNSFLYVASAPNATSPGVYVYTIGSTGLLSPGNSGNPLATDQVSAPWRSPRTANGCLP